MTSGRSDRGLWSERAFTFLEIMLVLALIAIIFVGSAPLLSASSRERRLRDAAQEIERLVRSERLKAMEKSERRVLEIRPAGFFERALRPAELLAMPAVGVSLRAPGEKFAKPGGQEWEFSPLGLVTPYTVRLEDGPAWLEVDFDLLTGRRADERYAF